ncbi:MAG: bifunctional diaminohydroxyphosphoribosylaminopyrimidine deaminase/5-amino-6-(5-phosphoribosylamino)uracil reductase RibD [Alphaproteobacteria bacterium]|nr:bifunctional diaminohydroxyphosphoribosylaminopyrimidine deaminase/5-amino-6-(5-phosphoribosylamino)uracil reductase RibD [Alphaproteobacteria bacterium]
MTSPEDIHYMHAALDLARRGLGRVAPNPSVGCVLVKNGHVIATGFTQDGGRPHAEAVALEKAGMAARGATAYVTLEPCAHRGRGPTCAESLVLAGIKRAVIACHDPDPRTAGKGIEILKVAGIEVTENVLKDRAVALNAGFFLKIHEGRPLVTLKAATTKDGFAAPVSKERQWITGELARRHAHLERSMHDAVLVGIGTILNDNPMLTTRLEGVEHKPVRVVLDSNLRIQLGGRLVQSARETPLRIFYKDDPWNKAPELEKAGVKIFNTEITGDSEKSKSSVISVFSVLKKLAEEGITRLLVEGGPMIWDSFIKERLCDRVLWYKSPAEMGQGIRAFEAFDADILNLRHTHTRLIGEDLLEIYEKQA